MSDRPDVDHARFLAARGDATAALATLDAVLGEEPDHLEALLLKASLLLESREGEDALRLFERAAAAWPRSVEASNALARCLHSLGRHDEALAAAESARRLLAEQPDPRQRALVSLTLVWCLREKRRYRDALAVAEEALAQSPDAVLAEWAGVIEEEMVEAEKERC